MAIEVGEAFKRTSAAPIDESTALTKAEMLAVNDNLMPDKYFTICQDDGKLYLYDKSATPSAETGKFKKLEGGGGGTTPTLDDVVKEGNTTDTPIKVAKEFTTANASVEVTQSYIQGLTTPKSGQSGRSENFTLSGTQLVLNQYDTSTGTSSTGQYRPDYMDVSSGNNAFTVDVDGENKYAEVTEYFTNQYDETEQKFSQINSNGLSVGKVDEGGETRTELLKIDAFNNEVTMSDELKSAFRTALDIGGGGGGSYNDLPGKPRINNVELINNKTGGDLQLQDKMDEISNSEIDTIIFG